MASIAEGAYLTRSTAITSLLLLTGCTVGTNYSRPTLDTPTAWQMANKLPRPVDTRWWRSYSDPRLDRLVSIALAGNLDIEQALARIDQARAAARYAGAAELPSGEINGLLGRERLATAAGIGQLAQYLPDFPRTQNEARVTAGAAWDLDFAGGLRRNREAANAGIAAAVGNAATARLTVATEVTNAYLHYRGAQAQLATLKERRAAMADRHDIVALRVRAGTASEQALDVISASLAAVDAAIPVQRAILTVMHDRIAVLTGQPAQTSLPELDGPATVPLAADPAAGVPGDILRQRPDVLAAEARLRAAHARVGVALAEYWPKLSLSALIGFDTTDLSQFGSDASNIIQATTGLHWRLFDFGRINAEVSSARGKERELLAAYRSAVLSAGEQVESSFAMLAARRVEFDRRTAQRNALTAAYHRAQLSFKAGQISRDRLRVSELAQLDAEDALISARTELSLAIATCHRALGG